MNFLEGGPNVTSVYGSIKRGEKSERLALEVEGKLSKAQWELFKAELTPVLRKYRLKFGDLQIKKSKKKKSG